MKGCSQDGSSLNDLSKHFSLSESGTYAHLVIEWTLRINYSMFSINIEDTGLPTLYKWQVFLFATKASQL